MLENIDEEDKKLTHCKLIKRLNDHNDSQKIKAFLNTLNLDDSPKYLENPDYLSFGKINSKIKNISIIDPSNTNNNTNRIKTNKNIRPHAGSLDFILRSESESCTNKNKSKLRLEKSKNDFSMEFKVLDNKSLRLYYDNIRKKINDKKYKKDEEKSLLTNLPKPICSSLKYQQKIFLRTELNDKNISRFGDKLKKNIFITNSHKSLENIDKIKNIKKSKDEPLLINKSQHFQTKSQELNIIESNVNQEVKYGHNLWKITLRNHTLNNGEFERKGYYKAAGMENDPLFSLFIINPNQEMVANPKIKNILSPSLETISHNGRSSNKYNFKRRNNNNPLSLFDEKWHSKKTKQELQRYNSINELKVVGKNLMNFEEEQSSSSNNKKFLYSRTGIEQMIYKRENKLLDKGYVNFEPVFDDRLVAKNFIKRDYYKNANLITKCSSSHNHNTVG